MQLGVQNLLPALQQLIAQQLSLHIFKAQALDGLGKALSGFALLPEEQNRLFNDGQRLLLVGKDLAESLALSYLLAPAAADIDLVAIGPLIQSVEVAGTDAASAVVANALVDLQHAVHHFGRAHGAGLDHAALFAAGGCAGR